MVNAAPAAAARLRPLRCRIAVCETSRSAGDAELADHGWVRHLNAAVRLFFLGRSSPPGGTGCTPARTHAHCAGGRRQLRLPPSRRKRAPPRRNIRSAAHPSVLEKRGMPGFTSRGADGDGCSSGDDSLRVHAQVADSVWNVHRHFGRRVSDRRCPKKTGSAPVLKGEAAEFVAPLRRLCPSRSAVRAHAHALAGLPTSLVPLIRSYAS